MNKYYKCIKQIEVPFCDDEGNITNKKMIILPEMLFYRDDKNNNPIDADVTLYAVENGDWLGISYKIFKESFKEVEK